MWRTQGFLKHPIFWGGIFEMGWCLAERLEKKHYKQHPNSEAFFFVLVNHRVKGKKNWMEHGHLIWLWMVSNGLQPQGILQVLVIEVWTDVINVKYIDIWAACKILHDVAYSTIFFKQKSNRIQPAHACLRLRNPSKEDTPCSNLQLWNYLQNFVDDIYLFCSDFCSNKNVISLLWPWEMTRSKPLIGLAALHQASYALSTRPKKVWGLYANDVGGWKTTELVGTGWSLGYTPEI